MSDIECPYCNEPQVICHQDGYGYQEGEKHWQTCHDCDKTFVYKTSITFHYTAMQAECLNGQQHAFELTTTHPNCFTRWRCRSCGQEKQLTNEDRIQHNIETPKQYFARVHDNEK